MTKVNVKNYFWIILNILSIGRCVAKFSNKLIKNIKFHYFFTFGKDARHCCLTSQMTSSLENCRHFSAFNSGTRILTSKRSDALDAVAGFDEDSPELKESLSMSKKEGTRVEVVEVEVKLSGDSGIGSNTFETGRREHNENLEQNKKKGDLV